MQRTVLKVCGGWWVVVVVVTYCSVQLKTRPSWTIISKVVLFTLRKLVDIIWFKSVTMLPSQASISEYLLIFICFRFSKYKLSSAINLEINPVINLVIAPVINLVINLLSTWLIHKWFLCLAIMGFWSLQFGMSLSR